MIAALPMYDPPALQAANDRLWAAVRDALGQGPHRLTRGVDLRDIWRAPDLLLAQTCGMPYRKYLCGHVTLVGAPDHGLPGLPAGVYQTVIVTRSDDARGLRDLKGAQMAVNDPISQSGWSAPMRQLEAAGVAPNLIPYTGAHAASALAVAEGRADLAGLDVVTWDILKETEPALAGRLRVIDRTEPTPALPYITAKGRDAAALRRALSHGIAALSDADRHSLRLHGVVESHASDYLRVPDPRTDAAALSNFAS